MHVDGPAPVIYINPLRSITLFTLQTILFRAKTRTISTSHVELSSGSDMPHSCEAEVVLPPGVMYKGRCEHYEVRKP
jgi:hypothetical protein